jgi:hypothetical protein
MTENELGSSVSPGPARPAAGPRSRRWQVPIGIAVVVGVLALVIWLTTPGKPVAAPLLPQTSVAPSAPLGGKLMVFIRPPVRATEPLPVEERGALPARTGGIMSLQVLLDQPGFSYLVWLDCEGKVTPLYPWNTRDIEVKDLSSFPPQRKPTKVVYSPLLGGGWPFGEREGMETVLFLSRSTPLPEGTAVGQLLGDLPPPVAVREPTELVTFEVKDHAKTVTTVLSRARGDESAANAADEPLKALLIRLSPHFDLVRAVRFAHVAADTPAQPQTNDTRP